MKKVLAAILFLLMACFDSCVIGYDALVGISHEETIQLNLDGSGTYVMKLDLRDLIIQNQPALDAQPSGIYDLMKMDTTISFDSSSLQSVLTEDEKLMFQGGNLHIILDLSSKTGIIATQLVYKNYDQLDFDMKHIWNFISNNLEFGMMLPFLRQGIDYPGKTSLTFKVIQSAKDGAASQEGKFKSIAEVFDIKISSGDILNKFDPLMWKNGFATDTALEKEADTTYTSRIFYKTTFILPTPIKTYSRPPQTLSADKKSITYANSLKEFLENPKKLEYSLKY